MNAPVLVSTRRGRAILMAMACSTFLVILVEALPAGLLTLMAPDLGVSLGQIGLLVTAYAAVVVIASLPIAHVTRNIPRRWVLAGCIGLIAVATVVGAVAPGYWLLLGARVITAVAQALFWVAVLPGTVGLFPPERRGKVLGQLAIGNALSPVLGVPLVAWIGSAVSWRVAFTAVGVFATLVCSAVLVLFPTFPPSTGGAAFSPHPSRARYFTQLAQTLCVVAGAFGLITFGTQYLRDITGVPQAQIAPVLLVNGVGGLIGAYLISHLLDRHAWATMAGAMLLVCVAQLVLYWFGESLILTVAGFAMFGFAFTAVAPTASHRVLLCAPGSVDMAVAGSAAVFNLGIAGGSALGAWLDRDFSVRVIPLVGVALVLIGFTINQLERARLSLT